MSASSDYLRVLTESMRESGATRAATQRANSQIYGNAVAKIGDYASDAVKQLAVDKKALKIEQEDAAITQLFNRSNQEWQAQQQAAQVGNPTGAPGQMKNADGTPMVGPELAGARPMRPSPFPSPSELMAVARPERAIPIINGLAAIHQAPTTDPDKNFARQQKMAEMLRAFPEADRAEAYPMLVDLMERQGVPRTSWSKVFNPTEWKGLMGTLPKDQREPLVAVPGPEGPVYGTPKEGAPVYEKPPAKPAERLVPMPGPNGPVYGTPTAGAPVYEKAGTAGAGSDFAQYLGRVAKEKGKTVEQLTAAEELAARKAYGQADDRAITISPTLMAEQGNARETALGIKDGTISPEVLLSTRATAQGMALNAELHKMGVDTNKMTREWTATKRAITSLNGAQQVRLAEVINKASESLDKVEELNKAWTDVGSRFGIKILNRASLRAAQNGAYGPEAASVAQRLDAQIADVTSELAQGIMGGNSPTDHAFELAKKNLSADWTQAVLNDAIKQARYNLNLAQNARNDILEKMGVQSTQVPVPPPASAIPPAAPKVNPFR